MKLAEDEQKLSEHYFKNVGDTANMSILSNRRLIVVYGNAEESYPLSKITAVRIIYNRSWLMVVIGALIALAGLAASGKNAGAAVIGLAIGGALVYFGWKGKTQLDIGQMGGHKHYGVRGRDPKLNEFMEAVNARLS
jgi:hypothetical protein